MGTGAAEEVLDVFVDIVTAQDMQGEWPFDSAQRQEPRSSQSDRDYAYPGERIPQCKHAMLF